MLGKACRTLSTLLMLVLLLLALALAGPHLIGMQTMVVLSGSMEPTIHTGGMVYIKEVPPQEIEVQDIITFTLSGGTPATHRVIEILPEDNAFITKGDANDVDDGQVSFDRLIGKVVFSVPYLGKLVSTLQSRTGIPIIAGIMILLVLLTFLPGIFSKEEAKEKPKK